VVDDAAPAGALEQRPELVNLEVTQAEARHWREQRMRKMHRKLPEFKKKKPQFAPDFRTFRL
jgi:hypothetical protein